MLPLQATITRIEKFVYDKGINVALDHTEATDTYKKMEKRLRLAMMHQIEIVAKEKNIENSLMFTKGFNQSLLTAISTILAKFSLEKLINFPKYLYWVGSRGGQTALDKLGIDGIFNLKNPELIAYFDDHSKLILDSVDDYTKKWIASKIQQGKDDLLLPREIVQSIVDEGKGISEVRAQRIMITETAKALITVQLAAAKRYGIQEKIWRTSKDDRVDPICLNLEGKRANINSFFPGGYEGPPAHPSCRCFIEEVVPDDWDLPSDPWLGE